MIEDRLKDILRARCFLPDLSVLPWLVARVLPKDWTAQSPFS